MQHEALWTPWGGPGIEHLRLTIRDGFTADSLVIGVAAGQVFRLHYMVRGDTDWCVRELRVRLLDEAAPAVHLLADGAGHWTTGDGVLLPALDGCLDVDISATPFTNTLPIRRLAWQPGIAAEIAVVYCAVPALQLWRETQRYQCIEAHADDKLFQFTSLDNGFTATLPTDADGLVREYPGLFRRQTLP